jgi:hypothetical protein
MAGQQLLFGFGPPISGDMESRVNSSGDRKALLMHMRFSISALCPRLYLSSPESAQARPTVSAFHKLDDR